VLQRGVYNSTPRLRHDSHICKWTVNGEWAECIDTHNTRDGLRVHYKCSTSAVRVLMPKRHALRARRARSSPPREASVCRHHGEHGGQRQVRKGNKHLSARTTVKSAWQNRKHRRGCASPSSAGRMVSQTVHSRTQARSRSKQRCRPCRPRVAPNASAERPARTRVCLCTRTVSMFVSCATSIRRPLREIDSR
jgi:hypothetical protein